MLKSLKPIARSPEEFDEVEAQILRMLKEEIYLPLLADIGFKSDKILNAKEGLLDAIRANKVTFSQGTFEGKFNASISRELRDMGAKFKDGKWRLELSKVPQSISEAIRVSVTRRDEAFKRVDKKLAEYIPEKLSNKVQFKKLFDRTIWKTNKKVEQSVKNISVIPKLSDATSEKIANEWAENMDKYIRDFTEKEIKSLRDKIRKNYFAGNRYEGMVNSIQKSYGVSQRKAKFLARQETNLLNAKFKESRYAEAGVREYRWRSVTGTPNHPTRARHKALDAASVGGKIFRFDDPPVTTEPGQPERRNNPGEDFNCRCTAIPVVRF